MPTPLWTIDAFTDRPFGGNQAAVCLLARPAPEDWMAAVAAEVNLPETAFVWPVGDRRWGLRWWTPTVEVALCGHATLAAAHALVEDGALADGTTATFDTASGALAAHVAGGRITLDFPAYEAGPLDEATVAAVGAVTALEPLEVVGYGSKLLARLADRDAVLAVGPDLEALARLPYEGLIVTAADGDGYVLRFFAPALGIPEDPVTGSAQCAAGPYWRARTGATRFAVEQLSARRGRLEVTVGDDGRVGIAGTAVTVLRGALAVDPPASAGSGG